MNNLLKNITLLGIIGLASSCNHDPKMTILGAIEGINVESDGRFSGGGRKFDQTRITNVSGILPFSEVGQMYQTDKNRRPSLAIPISEKDHSELVTVRYEAKADYEHLKVISTQMKAVETASANYAEKVLKHAVIQNELAGLNKINKAERTEKQKSSIANLTKQLSTQTIERAEAKTSLEKAEETAEASLMAYDNVVIFNWEEVKKSGWSLIFSTLSNLRYADARIKKGYVILSGFEISYLKLGVDINDGTYQDLSSKKKRKKPVTTHVWRAKHIVSLSNYEDQKEFEAYVKASYEQLSNLSSTIKKLDEIEIKYALESARRLSNRSMFGNPTETRKPLKWHDLSNSAGNRWNTFMAVQTYYKDLLKLYK